MKTIIYTLSIVLAFGFQELSADTKPVKAELKEATVFFSGAELTHKTSGVALTKGDNEITIEGISPNIDKNSLKIKASNGVMISSYEFSIDYLSDGKNNNWKTKALQDSVVFYDSKLTVVKTDYKINQELAEILKKSTDKNVSGSEKGLGIDELVKTMDYYKSKKTELAKLLSQNEKQVEDYEDNIKRLKKQIEQESTKNNKTSGILKITLSAPISTSSSFEISYYTTDAAWMPYYDINIVSTDKPIAIESKAKVRQTTGLDWNKVKLTLSSAVPSNGKAAPLFKTWFLQEIVQRQNNSGYFNKNAVQNSFSYTQNQIPQKLEGMIPGVQLSSPSETNKNLVIRGVGSVNTATPIYIVDGQIMDQESVNNISADQIKNIEVLKDASSTAIYGSRAANGAIVITLKSSLDDYISTSDNELNITYNIDIPFSVPGNGKEQSLTLKKDEINGKYKYYCAPKLDSETFLLTEIEGWEKLGLLTGNANITYDGTYIGESLLDASSTSKLLTLTLGSDKRVIVKREKMRDFSSSKFLGNDIKQVFTYKLTVKNNQNKEISMVLKDQYPISTQKNIEVELIDKDTTKPTVIKEDMGVVTWEETLKPGETKVYQISYSVKYPKAMNLNL